jgi:hypothetical protein
MKSIFLMILSMAFILSSCGSEEKKVDEKKAAVLLSFNPKVGKEYKMVYTNSTTIDSVADKTFFTVEIINKIIDVKNEKVYIESYYENAKIDAVINGMEQKIDAKDTTGANHDALLVAARYFVYYHQTALFEYDKQGRKVKEEFKNADTIPSLRGIDAKIQLLGRYSPNEINVGDNWETELEIKIGEKKIDKAIFTVKEINDKEVSLDIKGFIDGKGVQFGKDFTMRGSFTGEMIVDRQTGWQNKTAFHLQYVREMAGNKMTIRQEVTYNLK